MMPMYIYIKQLQCNELLTLEGVDGGGGLGHRGRGESGG